MCFLACFLAESRVGSEQDRERNAYLTVPNRLKRSGALSPNSWKPLTLCSHEHTQIVFMSTNYGHAYFSLLAVIWRRRWTRELNIWGKIAECTTDKPYQSYGVRGCKFNVWYWLWEHFVHLVQFMGWLHMWREALAIVVWSLSYFSFILLNVWLCWTIFTAALENILDSSEKMPRFMSVSFYQCLGNLWEWAKAGTGFFAEGGVPA